MSKETCFVHNKEIYFIVGAKEEDIDKDLVRMANDIIYEDFVEESNMMLQANIHLINRQFSKIKNKYCE